MSFHLTLAYTIFPGVLSFLKGHSISAVNACRWVSRSIPSAPYVTFLPWISHHGCHYVVHGDDITSDSNGEDCYRYVKAAGRFLVVKRTPGISTTDLVGRMLLCTKAHFIKSLTNVLTGEEGSGSTEERKKTGEEMRQRIKEYATDETGLQPGPEVWSWNGSGTAKADDGVEEAGGFEKTVEGKAPKAGQRIVYVDGGFDLFCSGHIEFLRQVQLAEENLGRKSGWYTAKARDERIRNYNEDFGPAYLIAGIHDDAVINQEKGLNYPIMNIFERGLCVLQCRVWISPSCSIFYEMTKTAIQYIHSIVFSAPFTPSRSYLDSLPYSTPHAVYHGPTAFIPLTYDPYIAAKEMGIFHQVPAHDFQNVDAGEIVLRIVNSRAAFEERQRMKGVKAVGEELVREKEEEVRKTREAQKETMGR